MKRALVLMAVAIMVASVATAAPDPWRIRVTDYDQSTPYLTGDWLGVPLIDSSEGSWTASGGKYRQYWWFGAIGGGGAVGSATYTASTGAISFGPVTSTSVEGRGIAGMRDSVVKVGAGSYKMWRRYSTWDGREIQYATSTDGANFSVTTDTTFYGPTITSTGTYGHGVYVSTGGVWLSHHRNSGANYQNAGSMGVATSTLGETEWYDIDTGQPDPILPPVYSLGDPMIEPHTAGGPMWDSNNYSLLNKACDGNLLSLKGSMQYNSFPGWDYEKDTRGMGLSIGTGGELAGGDHYVWLADVNNSNTQGVGNSLLSGIGRDGLGGPSLRASELQGQWWTGWPGYTIPIGKSANNQAATRFLMIYDAMWDTDSSGDGITTYDVYGTGRAKLLLTRNKADLNYDGTVSASDIGPFSGAYGSTSGLNSTYNPDADMNASGKVDASDIGPFSGRYGSDCSYGQ